MLDLDFNSSPDRPLRLLKNSGQKFMKQFQLDLNYLKSIGAMNYSLGIGIYSVAPPPPSPTATTITMSISDVLDKNTSMSSRCFGNVDNKIVYLIGFLKIHDRWEGGKKIGGTLSFNKNRTNVNPKDYSKRLLAYMVESIVQG